MFSKAYRHGDTAWPAVFFFCRQSTIFSFKLFNKCFFFEKIKIQYKIRKETFLNLNWPCNYFRNFSGDINYVTNTCGKEFRGYGTTKFQL